MKIELRFEFETEAEYLCFLTAHFLEAKPVLMVSKPLPSPAPRILTEKKIGRPRQSWLCSRCGKKIYGEYYNREHKRVCQDCISKPHAITGIDYDAYPMAQPHIKEVKT